MHTTLIALSNYAVSLPPLSFGYPTNPTPSTEPAAPAAGARVGAAPGECTAALWLWCWATLQGFVAAEGSTGPRGSWSLEGKVAERMFFFFSFLKFLSRFFVAMVVLKVFEVFFLFFFWNGCFFSFWVGSVWFWRF